MVVYLPTILMNMINQATNYIPTEDKYQLVYTINMYAKLTISIREGLIQLFKIQLFKTFPETYKPFVLFVFL